MRLPRLPCPMHRRCLLCTLPDAHPLPFSHHMESIAWEGGMDDGVLRSSLVE